MHESRKSYLVMSGGLGSSPYIRKRLKEHYEGGLGGSRTNASGMRILLSAEPLVSLLRLRGEYVNELP
jgi:hypothetical protein